MASPDSAVRHKRDVVSSEHQIVNILDKLEVYEKVCVLEGVFAKQPTAAKLYEMSPRIFAMMNEKHAYHDWRKDWPNPRLYALAETLGFGFLLKKDNDDMVVDEALARFIFREELYLDADGKSSDEPSSSSDPPPPRKEEEEEPAPASIVRRGKEQQRKPRRPLKAGK